jgi:[ribosomal protein S18]-alanine N-acetyltransferase
VKIRTATPDDVHRLIQLEQSSSTAAHWTADQYHDLFQSGPAPHRLVLIAESTDAVLLGFLVAQHIASEWELENIVVAAAQRRKGIAKTLLDALIDHARASNSEAIFLEVRESNGDARALYQNAGFQEFGSRKGYYSDPLDDAILYRFKLA